MNSTAYRAALMSLVLVLSSLAGCLGGDEEEDPTIMVSTYHVGELVSAVAGDTLDVEIISPSNIPVHDYEPSAADIARLMDSEIFFYHGLNLEPWVDTTLDALGDDAPIAVMTHTMPTGQDTLDYESVLISNLCEVLTEGPFESTTLGTMSDDHDDHDDHGDDHSDEEGDHDDDHDDHSDEEGNHDDDHDDHSDEEGDHDDDHDGHSDEEGDHDGHDDHEGHEHAEAEETIQNPADCPADTVISIFHMEEGEYVLEFESEHDEDFNMAALKMPGGHAHHDHHGHGDHDDHSDDEDDHDDHSDDEDDHDDHSDDEDDHDDEMCHNTDTHENYESTEDECEAAGHVWMEDGHDDHHGVCHDTTTHENHDEYENEEECAAAGHMWMEEEEHDLPEIHADFVAHTLSFPEDEHDDHDDDHDDHSDEEGDHDDHDDHSDEEGHHEVGYVVIHIEEEGDYGFALPTDVEFFVLMNDDHDHGHDDHDDHSDEEDDHSDEEDGHDDHSSEEIEYDPHSWLSPLAFKAQADLVVEALSQQYPEHKDTFEENAEAFKAELDSLHMKYSAISDECEQRTVVANHNAYSYIGQLYDIRFVTVHGLDPEGEPSAADIAEVLEQIEEDGLTVLFVEEYTNPDAVAGIVEQTKSGTMPDGISIQTLYTMEMPPMDSEDNYLSLMEKNLDSLKAGMGC